MDERIVAARKITETAGGNPTGLLCNQFPSLSVGEARNIILEAQKWNHAQSRQARAQAEPIFAIGGLTRGDGAEIRTAGPRTGKRCRRCGQYESDGANFTTIKGGNVCDDCL